MVTEGRKREMSRLLDGWRNRWTQKCWTLKRFIKRQQKRFKNQWLERHLFLLNKQYKSKVRRRWARLWFKTVNNSLCGKMNISSYKWMTKRAEQISAWHSKGDEITSKERCCDHKMGTFCCMSRNHREWFKGFPIYPGGESQLCWLEVKACSLAAKALVTQNG